MIRIFGLFLAFTFIFPVHISRCQTVCTNPLAPFLNFVSVSPGTGQTELRWTSSPSANVVAYIVHKFRNGIRTPVDTIWDPLSVSHIYTDVETKYYSLSYVVSALRLPDCESPLSNSISTVFLSSSLDSCNRRINLTWSSYPDIPKKVLRYEVHASNSSASAVYDAGLATSYTISDFRVDEEYHFSVSAILEGGGKSSSRNDTLFTGMTRPPDWINADFATVSGEGKITLSFTIDPLSEIKLFRLERKEGSDGTFQQIAELSGNSKITYTDEKSSTQKVNFYRLTAINLCGLPVNTSNISSNIVLVLFYEGTEIKLSWNRYREWQGALAGYRVLYDPGDGYSELASTAPGDTTFTFPYSRLISRISGSEVCFRISASETSNPYGLSGESSSAPQCLEAVEVITVPNLFTPDGDLLNDYFKPVLSFVPADYHLIITDRGGKKLFETRNSDESWDGTSAGVPLPAGVYLWFLKTTGPGRKSFPRSGTVTIYRSR